MTSSTERMASRDDDDDVNEVKDEKVEEGVYDTRTRFGRRDPDPYSFVIGFVGG
eukprot:CAMPEP_0175085530 /NCGR_PEP_ID=MMETSP0052_2-20121109/28718_1 /TAXON_ID=51329 ORGANISM="Polytomella parva, Strain SAG 63-3" /NCGR_SAMPLE_ID=MMETSP0052_2 /ASSEMBLY_ACC=CAM_ASM_000194 /LENGTH=53 /DNA_ID=CAMNT_0016357559 /DNA_START=474 /DNA_END=635 /DNA_ORIENTATION=-